jgi:hypothetical protein
MIRAALLRERERHVAASATTAASAASASGRRRSGRSSERAETVAAAIGARPARSCGRVAARVSPLARRARGTACEDRLASVEPSATVSASSCVPVVRAEVPRPLTLRAGPADELLAIVARSAGDDSARVTVVTTSLATTADTAPVSATAAGSATALRVTVGSARFAGAWARGAAAETEEEGSDAAATDACSEGGTATGRTGSRISGST